MAGFQRKTEATRDANARGPTPPPEKIRIAVIVPGLLPGGAEMLVRHIFVIGLKEWFEPVLCSLRGPLGSFLEKDLCEKKIKVKYLGQKHLQPTVMSPLYRFLKEFRPHIVHTHLKALAYALLPALLARVPVRVHTVHSFAHSEGSQLFRIVSGVAFKIANFVPIGISESIGQSIRDYYRIQNVPIVNNGIPTDLYDYSLASRASQRNDFGFSDDAFVCIHVGRFVEAKNHSLLIAAFARAIRKMPHLRLVLVGEGPLKKQVENMVEELGVSKEVTFLGKRSDVPALLSGGDLFVFSSKREGLPLTIIEAMASGLPVLSTSVGGIRDLLTEGETGYLVKHGDAASLETAIIRIASDYPEAKRRAQNALRLVKHSFDIGNSVEGYERLYEEMMKPVK